MRYIVTGATSFIGAELVALLLSRGFDVTAVCRSESNGIGKIPDGADIVFADMKGYCSLDEVISSADVFVNLAWEGTGHIGRDSIDTQNSNVTNTLMAAKAASRMGCKLFVEAGSQAEYGSTEEPQAEKMKCVPFSEYGKAKLKVWDEASRLSEALGLKYLHLRIFSIIGQNDHPWTLVMSSLDKMLRNESIDLSQCTQNWNFLDVRDAVQQILALCSYAWESNSFLNEIFNIASCDTRPLSEFIEEMKRLSGSSSVLNYGAVTPEHFVSLQPDMSKTKSAIRHLGDRSFRDTINLIITEKKNHPWAQ